MNRATMILGALATFSLTVTASAQQTPSQADPGPIARPDQGAVAEATPSKQDIDFFNDAGQGGLLEVRLGQLALQKSSNDEVRKFAQRMVDDHGKLNAKLTQLGQNRRGLTTATDLDTKHKKLVDDLGKETGVKFDRDYMSRMIDDHQSDVKAFEKEAKDGTDPEMKAAAAEALPTLYDHLNQAKQIHEHVKK